MKKTASALLFGAAVSTALIFQNCGKGFKASNQLAVGTVASASSTPLDPDAIMIYDSSIGSGTSELMLFDPTGVQFSNNQIADQRIQVKNMGASCAYAQLLQQGTRDWPADCWWALQVFFAARKSYQFFSAIGAVMPAKLVVNTQNKSAPCMAHASGASMDLCQFEETYMREHIQDISPVIYHEMAHIAQGAKAANFGPDSRMSNFAEDHAALFTYLLSGQTNFLNSHNGPLIRVYDSSVFFGWKAVSAFESQIALTTFLISSHQVLIKSAQKSFYEAITQELGKLFLNIINEATANDDAQKVINRFLGEYDKTLDKLGVQNKADLVATLTRSLLDRNLDLAGTLQSGYSVALTSQGFPADAGGNWKSKQISAAELKSPTLQLFQSRPNSRVEAMLPLQVIIAPKNYGSTMDACLKSLGTTVDPKLMVQTCVMRAAGTGAVLQNGTVKDVSVEFKKIGDTVTLQFTPSANCTGTDYAFGKVFDSQGKDMMSFPIIFGCGP